MERRHFLQALLATTAVARSGPCWAFPSNENGQLERDSMSVLSGKPVAKGVPLDLAFDAHVHIFNGADIQTSGYLKGPVLNGLGGGFFYRNLVKLIGAIVDQVMRSAPSARRELRMLNGLPKLLSELGEQDPGMRLSGDIGEQYQVTKDVVKENIAGEIYQTYVDAVAESLSAVEGAEFDDEDAALVSELREGREGHLDAIVDSYYRVGAYLPEEDREKYQHYFSDVTDRMRANRVTLDRLEAMLQLSLLHSAPGFLRFVIALLAFRYTNLETYRHGFSTSRNAFGVDACFAAMVDFDYWLGDCDDALTSLKDQIELMHRLAVMFHGFMVPLAAYNPWPDDEDHAQSMALLHDAVANKGFAGVKIYPAIGYKPSGNSSDQYHPRDKAPETNQLNLNLASFFKTCRDLEIPVMAHANRTMGEFVIEECRLENWVDYRDFGGPEAWEAFFIDQNNPDNRTQRVNLGHIGGAKKECNAEDSWTYQFMDLAQAEELRYLFGDIGFWTDLYHRRRSQHFRDALRKAANIELNDGTWRPGVDVSGVDRLVFGSDWMMMIREGGWTRYPWAVYDALRYQDTFSVLDLRKIYDVNVLELYGLPQWRGSRTQNDNFIRLQKYYARYGVSPAWFERIQQRNRKDALGV